MAKQKTLTIDNCKALVTTGTEQYRTALQSETPPDPAQCCAIEAAIDAARIAGIRLAFDGRSECARDHCISQGLSIDVAEEAAATRGAWHSPNGGVIGIEPPKNLSAPNPQSSDAPQNAVGTEAEPIAGGSATRYTSTPTEPAPS